MVGTPVGEFHDVSHSADGLGVLVGFLDPRHIDHVDQAARKAQVIKQFEQCFPGAAERLRHYEDYLWFADTLSASAPPSEHPVPEDPRRAALFADPNSQLIWASSETSAAFPGYLEGAVAGAERAAQEALRRFQSA
jgi:monoamine oxidase